MRWRWTRSIRAAFTSARRAGRCMYRVIPATTGRRSCTTCRRCSQSRYRRCHEGLRELPQRDQRSAIGLSREAGMIRVVLPSPLRSLAGVDGEISVDVSGAITQRTVLDAVEARYPMLRGTMRDHVTRERRAFVRFFACETDLSLELPDTALPNEVAEGKE